MKGLNKNWDGSSWFRGFEGRHKTVFAMRKAKPLVKKRTSNSLIIDVETWIPKITKFLDEHPTLREWIFNADESWIRVTDGDLVEFVLESKNKARPGISLPKTGQHATFLPFVNVLGNTWLVAYLITGTTKMGEGGQTTMNVKLPLPKMKRLKRKEYERVWLATEKGFMNGRAWHAILKKFVEVIKPHRGNEEVILFVDNASPHKDMETIKYLMQEKVY